MENSVLSKGFPSSIKSEYEIVISSMSGATIGGILVGIQEGYNSENEWYSLADGTSIRIPYRIYYEDEDSVYDKLSETGKLVYDCIYTRSYNGFTRQKHLSNILQSDIPEWCMPYVLRLSSEYVVEILALMYDSLRDRDVQLLRCFCRNNPRMMKKSYQRMASYWNEFYREQYPHFNEYIGKKLYSDCFMPRTNFERL